MEKNPSFVSRSLKIIAFGLAALGIAAAAGGIWSALAVANLRKFPQVPWSFPLMAVLLWLMWSWLGGKWWPRSTSQPRRIHLRANRRSTRTYLWAWLAGGLSVIALAGLWIVLYGLVKMPPNALSDLSGYPRMTVALLIVMGSLVAPFMEEAGFRGYFQVALEREFRGSVAVMISSAVFAVVHLSHGLYWPKLLVYFLVGISFGATACLTKSTIPAILPHIIGLLSFFIFVWPYDGARRLVWESGAESWFWLHVMQTIVFTLLAVWAFQRLAKVCRQDSSLNDTNVAI